VGEVGVVVGGVPGGKGQRGRAEEEIHESGKGSRRGGRELLRPTHLKRETAGGLGRRKLLI